MKSISSNIDVIYSKNNAPIFLYSKKRILSNISFYLRTNFTVFYALKANYNSFLIKLISSVNIGFEVVSIYELKYLLMHNIDMQNVIFSGISKSKKDLEFALKIGVGYINIESFSELILISNLLEFTFSNFYTKFLVKINLNINVSTISHITTCTFYNKFGIFEYQVSDFFSLLKKLNIPLYGIGFHLGSQIFNHKSFIIAYKKILCLSLIFNLNIKVINIGGGIGVDYINGNSSFLDYILKIFCKYMGNFCLIFIEPGRSIIANSCITFSKVMCLKKVLLKNFAVLDVGMDSVIRPALYNSFHRIVVLNSTSLSCKLFDFVGPICESTDVFARSVFCNVRFGSYIFICDTGAYCLSMRMNYNLRNKSLEYFV